MAIGLTGGAYLQRVSVTMPDLNGNWTATCKFLYDSNTTKKCLFWAGNSSSADAVYVWGDTLGVERSDDGGGFASSSYGTNLVVGTWYHLTVVGTATSLKAYIDGILKETATHTLGSRALNRFYVGHNVYGEDWDGDVAGLAIRDVALSGGDITTQMAQQDPISLTGIYGYYHFVSSAVDESSNGYDWSELNGPTWETDPPSWPYTAASGGGIPLVVHHRKQQRIA